MISTKEMRLAAIADIMDASRTGGQIWSNGYKFINGTPTKGNIMGDLTKNFNRSEYACRGLDCCGHSAVIVPLLYNGVQELRALVGVPLTINSGFRCNKHNAATRDASKFSRHTTGEAADILCPSHLDVDHFAMCAEKIHAFRRGGIGRYDNRIHVDVRKTGPARWDNR